MNDADKENQQPTAENLKTSRNPLKRAVESVRSLVSSKQAVVEEPAVPIDPEDKAKLDLQNFTTSTKDSYAKSMAQMPDAQYQLQYDIEMTGLSSGMKVSDETLKLMFEVRPLKFEEMHPDTQKMLDNSEERDAIKANVGEKYAVEIDTIRMFKDVPEVMVEEQKSYAVEDSLARGALANAPEPEKSNISMADVAKLEEKIGVSTSPPTMEDPFAELEKFASSPDMPAAPVVPTAAKPTLGEIDFDALLGASAKPDVQLNVSADDLKLDTSALDKFDSTNIPAGPRGKMDPVLRASLDDINALETSLNREDQKNRMESTLVDSQPAAPDYPPPPAMPMPPVAELNEGPRERAATFFEPLPVQSPSPEEQKKVDAPNKGVLDLPDFTMVTEHGAADQGKTFVRPQQSVSTEVVESKDKSDFERLNPGAPSTAEFDSAIQRIAEGGKDPKDISKVQDAFMDDKSAPKITDRVASISVENIGQKGLDNIKEALEPAMTPEVREKFQAFSRDVMQQPAKEMGGQQQEAKDSTAIFDKVSKTDMNPVEKPGLLDRIASALKILVGKDKDADRAVSHTPKDGKEAITKKETVEVGGSEKTKEVIDPERANRLQRMNEALKGRLVVGDKTAKALGQQPQEQQGKGP